MRQMVEKRHLDQRFKVPAEFLINLYHEDPDFLNPTPFVGGSGREGTPSEVGGSGGGAGMTGRSPSPGISGLIPIPGGPSGARKRKKAGGVDGEDAGQKAEEQKVDVKLTLEQAKRRKVVLEDEELAAARLKAEGGGGSGSQAEVKREVVDGE